MAKFDPVGHRQSQEASVSIDNPDFDTSYEIGKHGNKRSIRAIVNMGESPAALWYHKNKIIDEFQLKAANKFRRTWENGGGRGVGALDYSKDVVDGGGAADPISERQVTALQALRVVYSLLGAEGYEIIEKTCGQCLFVNQIDPRRRRQNTIMETARSMLEILAHHYGYKTRPVRSHRAA